MAAAESSLSSQTANELGERRKWRVTVLISGSGERSLERNYLVLEFAAEPAEDWSCSHTKLHLRSRDCVFRSRAQSSYRTAQECKLTLMICFGAGSNLAALMAALPTTLSNVEIVAVFSNAKDAYGLVRAAEHKPVPIPARSYSPYNHQKANPELYGPEEAELKRLATSQDADAKAEWNRAKKALAAKIKPAYQKELAKRVRETKPDLIVLAGFMLILLPETLETLVRDWDETEADNGVEVEGTIATSGRTPYPCPPGPPKRGTPIPIINLHPALPGSFIGPRVIEDAWEAFNQRKIPVPGQEGKGDEREQLAATLAATTITDQGKDSKTSTTSSSSAAAPAVSQSADQSEAAPSEFGPKITKTGIMIHRVIPELDRGEPVLHREIDMKEGETVDELKERIHKVEHEAIVAAVKRVTEQLADGSWWGDVTGRVEDGQ